MSDFFHHSGIEYPWLLMLLFLGLFPWFARGHESFPHPSMLSLPKDTLSIWVECVWRLLGSLLIMSIVLALAGIYWGEPVVERVGRGAHIMMVLDRSASMNDDFADKPAEGSASKMAAARRVLQTFVDKGHEDLIGMVTFSTSPILVAPLGGDREAVKSALKATDAGGMGFTAIARGLGLALDYFEGKPMTGSRVVLLVSDGGAHLDSKTQDMLRAMFIRQHASLYWIFMRSANGASISAPPEEGREDAYPEYHLHQFFSTLGVPYKAYEAESPSAVETAIADIARLKNQPVRYFETAPRHNLSSVFYLLALLCGCGLFALHLTEVKQWRAA